eukprot:1655873-Pleurochrysis_carterae.AAC.1
MIPPPFEPVFGAVHVDCIVANCRGGAVYPLRLWVLRFLDDASGVIAPYYHAPAIYCRASP